MHGSITNLSKAYGYLWALRDISLELRPGDLVALLGPNGAGKTTLLRAMAGLLRASAGAITFDGTVFTPEKTNLRATIGLLAPADHLYEQLTVQENLRLFCQLYDKNRDPYVIREALSAVGLGKRADEFVANLSSGMKCRLSIAKWRLIEPGLLLLDEPYGVLDGGGIDLLETFLKERCNAGNIVVVASHHISRVLALCNRAVILHQGRLIFDEPRQTPWPSFAAAFNEFLPQGESCAS